MPVLVNNRIMYPNSQYNHVSHIRVISILEGCMSSGQCGDNPHWRLEHGHASYRGFRVQIIQ